MSDHHAARHRTVRCLAVATSLAGLALIACGEMATLPLAASFGPTPQLPAPNATLIPTIKVAKALGWPDGTTPVTAPGLRVNSFATGLDHPRFLYVLPNGDVLVAETNAPPKPDDNPGIKGWFFRRFQAKGGGGVPSANRISLLRDVDGSGIATLKTDFLVGLNAPFGIVLVGQTLYVANSDAVVSFPYVTGATRIEAAPTTVTALPAGRINHHWTKTIVAPPDGRTLYVSVGSNSNVGERGMAAEAERAAIWAVDIATGAHRLYATGLRNAVGLAFEPTTGVLWAAVNERDEIGGDLVPDYMTAVKDGGFYGWPYSYYGHHVDTRVEPAQPALVATALVPDYALGAHTASLGLAWSGIATLGPAFTHGMFVGQHGSWNRNPPSGYRVIYVPFTAGKPAGPPVDVLTGFLNQRGEAYGRPVGVAVDRRGALLVADDVGNRVWRVSAASATATASSSARP